MKIFHTSDYILLSFSHPLRTLSSSVFNGGFTRAENIVNLKTTAQVILNNTPETLIQAFIREKNISQLTVGLLTAAPMKYAQFILRTERDISVLAVVTAGVSNALNISERTKTPYSGESVTNSGTINIIVITNANLLEDCMVSSIIGATEAKAAALFDLNIKSVITGNQATGTGTDSIVIVSGTGEKKIQYAGGHTLYGQLLGDAVYTAVKSSLSKKLTEKLDFNRLCAPFGF
ncbi:MAG: adenosylcobinamide amidohydrolase [Spirochaetota bacterium]